MYAVASNFQAPTLFVLLLELEPIILRLKHLVLLTSVLPVGLMSRIRFLAGPVVCVTCVPVPESLEHM